MATDNPHSPPAAPRRPAAGNSAEIRAWIASLEAQKRSLGKRNRYLGCCFAVGLLLFLAVLAVMYQAAVRSYAVLENVQLSRHPANQGRLQISFQVITPGKVYLYRRSGSNETEVVDYFKATGEQQRQWSWIYQPGKEIDALLRYRGPLWRKSQRATFPTAAAADIVMLIDTTGSMSRSIAVLKDKCVQFSTALKQKQLEHRFALLGFGDTHESEWKDQYDFTSDVAAFKESLSGIKRFDGGDLPESALDALEAALELPFEAGAMRRFYLVTDAPFHDPSQSGLTAADLAQRLADKQVLLSVFTRQAFAASYRPLVADSGSVQEIEDFGQVLSEGRVLED
jgi:hypothetical protein